MKKRQFYLFALIVSFVSFSFYSCENDENNEPDVMPSFGIESIRQYSASGGTLECSINNYKSMTTVEPTVSWITANLSDTNGNLSISISENNTTSKRDGELMLLYNGNVVDRLWVNQNAGNNNSEENQGSEGQEEFGSPTGLSLSKNGYTVTLTWNKVPNAIKYFICFSNPYAYDDGRFVTNNSTTSTTFTMDCKIAGNWAFKIMAYDGNNYSGYSNTVTTSISESDINGGGSSSNSKPSKPTGLKAKVNGSQVSVSWNASTGASYYRLYYVKPAPYDMESFDNVYSTSTTMNCTIKGTWTIWVEAVGSNYETSDPSSKVTFNISSSGGSSGGGSSSDTQSQLDTPTGLKVLSNSTDSYVQLQCNAVSLGYDYQLYRSTSPNSGYSKISASVGTNSSGSIIYFTDSNPKKGTSYYKVKVAALSSLNIKDSDFSDYVKVVR